MANNYAQQLTPEQIQQILAAGQYGTANIGGLNYGLSGLEQNNEGGIGFTPQSILGYQPGDVGKAGASRAEYGLGGGFSQMGHNETPSLKDGIVPLLFALGAGAFAPGGFLAGGGSTLGGSGAFVGEGASSGIPAWDAAAGSGVGGLGGAPGVAFDGGGDLGAVGGDASEGSIGMNGVGNVDNYALTQGASGSLGAGYLSAGSAGAAGGLSGLLDSVGGLSGIAKYALPLVGGLLGSKGVTKTQQTQLPSQMQPYVYGQGGLLDSANGLFKQQTAPGGLPGYTQMQAVGQGLLNQPIAGNGVSQFQAMPRFGVPR